MPVNSFTLMCGYEECPFSTGDHVQGSDEEDHQLMMENHFELEHPPPSLVLVEGGEACVGAAQMVRDTRGPFKG